MCQHMSGGGKPAPLLSRAGAKPGSFGLSGSAGLQLKAPTKKFGLQPPPGKKALARPSGAASVFSGADAEDDLDDDASERARVSRELMRGNSAFGQAVVEATHAAALEQDSSVFDYDGVYDTMQQERKVAKQKPTEEKSARYMGALMKAHREREMENEKVFERKMVKEAEAEAHLYGDKERFMTSAYQKKLAAREEYEAELARQELEDQKNDVTKKGDLSGFYSNLLSTSLAPDRASESQAGADALPSKAGPSAPSVPPAPTDSPPPTAEAVLPPSSAAPSHETADNSAMPAVSATATSKPLVDESLAGGPPAGSAARGVEQWYFRSTRLGLL